MKIPIRLLVIHCLFSIISFLVLEAAPPSSTTTVDNKAEPVIKKSGNDAEQKMHDDAITKRMDTIVSVAQSKQFENERMIASTIRNIVRYASSGFKNGIESSVRSLFDKPLTGAVTAISMVIGAVALLAFYESPISPLPVPPLPDPPVGRFPPEYPIWPPKGKKVNTGYKQQYKRTGAPAAPSLDQAMAYSQIHNTFMYPPNVQTLAAAALLNQYLQQQQGIYQRSDPGKAPLPHPPPPSPQPQPQQNQHQPQPNQHQSHPQQHSQPFPMLYSQQLNQQQKQLQDFHNHLKQLQQQQQSETSNSGSGTSFMASRNRSHNQTLS